MTNAERIAKEIKESGINTKIVLGNIHPTIFAEETLSKGVADIIVRGEGDETLAEAILALGKGEDIGGVRGISYINNGKIKHNPDRGVIEDLDSLPFPDWRSLDLKYYRRYPMLGIYNKLVLPVQASRGCRYSCLFCSQDKFYKRFRHREIRKVVDEIECLHDNFQIDYIGFIDAYFPFSQDSGLEFCDELIRRKLHKKIKWFTETRVDMVNLELMRRMKEASLDLIMYGFEVGNQRVLDDTGKKTTLAQGRRAMEYTKKFNVRSMGLFMLGLPGDTRASCNETINFAKEIDPDIVKFNIAVPFPGSKFFEDYRNNMGSTGSLNNKFTSWYDWASYNNDEDREIIYSPKFINKKELVDLQRKGMFSFYMRPKIIIRHLAKSTFSFTDTLYGAFLLVKNYLKTLKVRLSF